MADLIAPKVTLEAAIRALDARRGYEVFAGFTPLTAHRLDLARHRLAHYDRAEYEAEVARILATAPLALPGEPNAADRLRELDERLGR